MVDKKTSKSKAEKVRVIFDREKSKDHLVKVTGKMCKETEITFIPSRKSRVSSFGIELE